MDPVQEIKLRLSIEEVVGQYVHLKRSGRSLKGLCPFHSEKTPSFIVSPDKGLAYCFGCHKGGDLFRFVMEVEHMEFREALEMLADRAGVALPKEAPGRAQTKTKLLNLQKAAAEFYVAQLEGMSGFAAQEYLQKRGVDETTRKRFGLGYAPAEWDAFTKHAVKVGLPQADLVAGGLAVKRDEARDGVYDRFRNRLMFPLRDSQGKVVAFTGRSLDGTEPKYLNSPESPTFSKGNFLFALDLARPLIREKDEVVLVEGQMDVVTCHMSGVANAVASSGTALTEHHLEALGKLTKNVLLAFDKDRAGVAATLKALVTAVNLGLSPKVVSLPGKDPDEAFRADRDATLAAFAAPMSPEDFLFGHLREKYHFGKADEKQKAVEEFFDFLREVKDPLFIDSMLIDAAGRFLVQASYFRERFEQWKKEGKKGPKIESASTKTPAFTAAEVLIGLFLNDPKLLPALRARLDGAVLPEPEGAIYRRMAAMEPFDLAVFLDGLEAEDRVRAELLILTIDTRYGAMPEDRIGKEAETLVRRVTREYVTRRAREINLALKGAASKEEAERLMGEQIELQKLLKDA